MNKRICLNQSVLDFMASKIDKSSFVVEFGAGWSSRWFAERCGTLISIETSHMWAETVRNDLQGAPCQWEVIQTAFPNMPLSPLFLIDLVLVDCLEQFRADCVACGWRNLKRGGWLVFDDAQRERHQAIVQHMNLTFPPAIELRWSPGDIETARERLAIAWQKPNESQGE